MHKTNYAQLETCRWKWFKYFKIFSIDFRNTLFDSFDCTSLFHQSEYYLRRWLLKIFSFSSSSSSPKNFSFKCSVKYFWGLITTHIMHSYNGKRKEFSLITKNYGKSLVFIFYAQIQKTCLLIWVAFMIYIFKLTITINSKQVIFESKQITKFPSLNQASIFSFYSGLATYYTGKTCHFQTGNIYKY